MPKLRGSNKAIHGITAIIASHVKITFVYLRSVQDEVRIGNESINQTFISQANVCFRTRSIAREWISIKMFTSSNAPHLPNFRRERHVMAFPADHKTLNSAYRKSRQLCCSHTALKSSRLPRPNHSQLPFNLLKRVAKVSIEEVQSISGQSFLPQTVPVDETISIFFFLAGSASFIVSLLHSFGLQGNWTWRKSKWTLWIDFNYSGKPVRLMR